MTIIEQVHKWSKERKASMFEITCKNEKEARAIQEDLQGYGYRGFVTHFGRWIGVILYLNEN